ncbi:ABC transporter ATP-binding protein [Luteitalea pratensis]|uniref:ABC transporter ATP-binding protein n=1 Tax=Luteitalea pratensis TaxID=1855912 RepID=UPI001F160EFE|nr:ATP-binding cassette domain-containing protein [Luteitalea pratensis]
MTFALPEGDTAILIGPSGSGKSLLLKLTLGLLQPDAGAIFVHGRRIDRLSERELVAVRDEIGMLFQEGALFDSLTVGENVGFKLADQARLAPDRIRARVEEVLGFIGLEPYIDRLPSELSGGQRRRVAIARAVAARPRVLLFDDPTAGLDPITAKSVDAEIIKLRDLQHVSALVVTHQLQDAFYIATHEAAVTNGRFVIRPRADQAASRAHVLLLRDGAIGFDGPVAALLDSRDPYVRTYLTGWVPPLSLHASAGVA